MPPMRFLCLHGAGTNSDIFQAQLGPLIRDLSKDNSAEFVFIDGELPSEPGPGVSGIFEPPYYSYFKWPRTTDPEDDKTVEAAYDLIYETLEEEGLFDGLIGFSHGATLAFSFLVNHAKTRGALEPIRSLGLRCAIFICAMPPFRENKGQLLFDEDVDGYLDIPSLTIAGHKDFVHEYSLRLAKLCNPGPARLLVHNKGHEIPSDTRNVREIAAAVRNLGHLAMLS